VLERGRVQNQGREEKKGRRKEERKKERKENRKEKRREEGMVGRARPARRHRRAGGLGHWPERCMEGTNYWTKGGGGEGGGGGGVSVVIEGENRGG